MEREDIIQSRNEWKGFQTTTESSRLVFLDESGLKTNVTRLYGRTFQDSRCLDSAPCGNWETTTILSSIRLEGAVDSDMFDKYIEEI